MITILYFQSSVKPPARQKFEGACGYGRKHGWTVQLIEPGKSEREAAKLVRFWAPKGVIVECGPKLNHYDPAVFGQIPSVFIDRDPKSVEGKSPCVTHDSVATAGVAAQELLGLGLSEFAYVPWPEPRFWSGNRESGFAEALRLKGFGYSRFSGKVKSSDVQALQKQLGKWLDGLPKPVGIFAANDYMALQVAGAASRVGLAIPDDVALVGVDNDELICENTCPTISSILPDFRLAGVKAAELLDTMMRDGDHRPESQTFGPLRLVRRASTNRFKYSDGEVLAALERIRREACNGLTAREVIAGFSCSRRTAEIRFRNATGKSPLEAIQEVRRVRAKELLADRTRDRNAIANLCGYSSANALMNFLRRK